MSYELLQLPNGVLSANGAIATFRFVKKSTVASSVAQADVGSAPVGISQQAAADLAGANFTAAGISKLELGTGGAAAGDPLAPDANGKGILAVGDAPIGAIALGAGVAGDIITVLNVPGFNPAGLSTAVSGVAAGYKVARGVHVQVGASDTVVTGLATVVAVVASFRDGPTVKQLFVEASEGDQAGTPAAGSILIKTFKPTAVNDVTPIAASDFSENLKIGWVAIGT